LEPTIIALVAFLAFGPVLHGLGSVSSHWWRRAALVAVLFLVLRYMYWRITETVPVGELTWTALYMQTVLLVEIAWLIETTHAYTFFWSNGAKRGRLPAPAAQKGCPDHLRSARVDVFIPTYNEGPEILERTIAASKRICWAAEVQICVLDDGRRPWLGEMCSRLGVRWLTRDDNEGAKAGNVNHALGQTTGDFILILDADFLAHPKAIERLMPAMADPAVAIAQAPQHFYNPDPVMRALGAGPYTGDDQSMFFDRILPARDAGDFAFFCGTCALLRRSALTEVGGLPTGSVTEDILLSVMLRKRGWQTRVVADRVATGLSPESLKAFFVQRARWSLGAIQLLYLRSGLLSRDLGARERFAFLPTYWIFSPLVRTASLIIPQLYLLFGLRPLENASVEQLISYQAPVLIAVLGLAAFVYRRRWLPLVHGVWADLIALRLAPTVVRDLIRPFRDSRFHVTPKGRNASRSAGSRMAYAVAAGVVLTLVALWMGAQADTTDGAVVLTMFWTTINLVRLLGVLTVLWKERREVEDPKVEVRCSSGDGFVLITSDGAMGIEGWKIREDRLLAPSSTRAFAGRLARRDENGKTEILARVEDDGRLVFGDSDARGDLLSVLVAMRVDSRTPYRPISGIAVVLAQLFGINRLARS
jgi:cellulose synthase (UDP-forming)